MANLLKPRQWKKKALCFKLEMQYGIDAVPTGAVNWIEARNLSLTPMDTDKAERNIDLPYMGNGGSVIVGRWAKLSFDVAMAPSGTLGTAPKWGPLLLACGMAETVTAATSVQYNLVSSNQFSATAYINIDGVVHQLFGMRGEVKGKMAAKGLPLMSFSFDALFVQPLKAAMPTVVRTGWMVEEGVNSKNTGPCNFNGIDLAYSSLDWSIGNKIVKIDLPGPQQEISISDRAPQATLTVLAPDLDVFNPFALAESGEIVPMSTVHGSAAGKKFTTGMNVRLTNVDYDKIDDLTAYKLTLEPLPVAGDDEIAFTCM